MAFSPLVCICNKLCTSKAGFTLHQRICKQAQEAFKCSRKSVRESDIIVNVDYLPEIREFRELAESIADDANNALSHGNKSAGRRSRVNIIKLGKLIIPLRKKILDKMKK